MSIRIQKSKCAGCGRCIEACPGNLIKKDKEGKAFIRVSDNGTGIPVEVQERIFIPFFTTKPSGSGIGLSISRQIMHMHKGDLSVLSENGQGSRFFVTFGSIQK